MTVAQLAKRLAAYDEGLEIVVRCEWEGEAPASNVFAPRLVVQMMEPDTGEDYIAIECDQDDDG